MKTKPIISGLAALSLIFLTLPSCKKDPAGDPGLAIKVQATNRTFMMPVQDGGPITPASVSSYVNWEIAQMVISVVTLEAMPAPEGAIRENDKIEMTWYGPELVDLFNLSATLGRIPLPPGLYEEIKFNIIARKMDAGNQPVFYLSGTYTNSGGKTFPLIVDISDDLEIADRKENVEIKPGSVNESSGIIEIYLNRLFSKILPGDLNEANLTDGTIIISAGSNPELYRLILEALQKNASSGIDEDRIN